MTHVEMLLAALVLDALFGEPRWLWSRAPHPVVLMGRAIAFADRTLNRGRGRVAKGAVTLVLLALLAAAIGAGLKLVPDFGAIEVLGAAILLAHRSLTDHVRAVQKGLGHSLEAGRAAVARIVGRDPEALDEAGVARAAIESGAESFTDGVVAPAFWFLVAGLPGILVYKLVNTADSMIGHMDETYALFGRWSARADDILTFIPARIAGVLVAVAALRQSAGDIMMEDHGRHASPNAGWTEAAMAGALGLALGGPKVYGGEPSLDPWINVEGRREATADDIRRALRVLWRAWVLLLGLVALMEALHWTWIAGAWTL